MRIITFLIYSVCISLVFLSIFSSPFSNRLAQGRVYEQNVTCIKTGLNGNVPGGTLSGPQAFDIINQANSLAIELLRQAESTLFVLPTIEPDSANATTVAALQNRFGLGITDPADLQFIPKLEFEYKQVKDYLDGGYTLYICRDPGCPPLDNTEFAFTRLGGTAVENHTIHLCSPFWNSDASDQAATILHEAFHIHWDQVNDQGFPQVHNAHCFEQFALDLKGIPINPTFADACAAPNAGEVAQGGGLGENAGVPECDPAVDANCLLSSSNETVADSLGDTSSQIEGGEIG